MSDADAGAEDAPGESKSSPPPAPQAPLGPDEIEKAAEYLRPRLRDPSEARRAVTQIAAISERFKGPLPHPRHLRQYNEIVPGSASTIINMATIEQRHRHKIQKMEMWYPYCGLIIGSLAFAGCLLSSIYLSSNGHDVLALAMLGVPTLGVIGWFIRSRIASAPKVPSTTLQND